MKDGNHTVKNTFIPRHQIVGRKQILTALDTTSLAQNITLVRDIGKDSDLIDTMIAKATQAARPVLSWTTPRYRRFARDPEALGIIAVYSEPNYGSLEQFLKAWSAANHQPFIIILDGVTNPYNIGGILRTAECAGVDLVLIARSAIPNHESRSIIERVAMGATVFLPYLCLDIETALPPLKEFNVRILGIETTGEATYDSMVLRGAVACVFGGEASGISETVHEKCDALLSIPINGVIPSLNITAAVAIVLFEKHRQEVIVHPQI